jgi:hypothetical protein
MAAGLVWYIKYLTLHHYEQQPRHQYKMTNSETRLHNGHSNMIVPPPAVSEKVLGKGRLSQKGNCK